MSIHCRQLQFNVNTSFDVDMYAVDLFGKMGQAICVSVPLRLLLQQSVCCTVVVVVDSRESSLYANGRDLYTAVKRGLVKCSVRGSLHLKVSKVF